MKEIWKPCPVDQRYQVSNLGRVKALPRTVTSNRWRKGDTRITKEKILRGNIIHHNYVTVLLGDAETGRHRYMVNRLVCEAFHGPPPTPVHQAAHYPDQSPLNNRADNLMWATIPQNSLHKRENGTNRKMPMLLTDEQVAEIRKRLKAKERNCDLAKAFGVSRSLITHIKNGRNRCL